MFRFRDHKIKTLFLTGALALLSTGAVVYYVTSQQDYVFVTLKEFDTDTKVKYEISASGQLIDSGEKILPQGEKLKLPISKKSSTETDVLSYKLKISDYNESKIQNDALEVLVELNKKTHDIDIKGSGLNEFSDISVKTGDNVENKINADWSGLFSIDSVNKELLNSSRQNQETTENVELAFQNMGMGTDFDKFNNGKMEVFFGDDDRKDRSDVRSRYTWSIISMTEQLSAVMVMQTTAIGMFFDARIQIETQRKLQELMARAHKDYHPSEQMCYFGTFMRNIAHTESHAEINKSALNRILMNQYLGVQHSSAAHGPALNKSSKIKQFVEKYCDPNANNGSLESICTAVLDVNGDGTISATESDDYKTSLYSRNLDIDYARLFAIPLTIDVNFIDADDQNTSTDDDHQLSEDEEAVISLAKHLYMPNVFATVTEEQVAKDPRIPHRMRSFAAKMNVAHSSFINIMGMKSSAPEGTAATITDPSPTTVVGGIADGTRPFWIDLNDDGIMDAGEFTDRPVNHMDNNNASYSARTVSAQDLTEDTGGSYMKALLDEFGMTDSDDADTTLDNEVNDILGERPSYYAQMEVLTKKIYQHPNFYTNLYDKPANVDRIGASITAISLMNQRDRYESILRREMLTSLLLEQELTKKADNINAQIFKVMRQKQE